MAERKFEKMPDNDKTTITNDENSTNTQSNEIKGEKTGFGRGGRGFQRNSNQGMQQRGRRSNNSRVQNNLINVSHNGVEGDNKDTFNAGMSGMNSGQGFGAPRNQDERFMENLQYYRGPTYDMEPINMTEKKFSARNRLYVGGILEGTTEAEVIELFKPFGEASEVFINNKKSFGFVRLDYHANAIKAKRELDGTMFKNNTIRVRFSPGGSAIKVKNLTPWVTNELLHYAFSMFGEIDRCFVIADERGKSSGEGIVEFVRKTNGLNALKRCNEGCFFLTSSLHPVIAESYDFEDLFDTFSEKSIFKKTQQYYEDREIGPRFAPFGSFEHEYGTQWKHLHEVYQKKVLALKQELELEQSKLEARMEFIKFENETKMLREQLRAREQDYERQKREWEECERMLQKQRQFNDTFNQEQEPSSTNHSLFLQAQQLTNMLNQQEQACNSLESGNDYEGKNDGQQQPLLPKPVLNDSDQRSMTPKTFMNNFDRRRNFDHQNKDVSSDDAIPVWNLGKDNDYNRKRRRN